MPNRTPTYSDSDICKAIKKGKKLSKAGRILKKPSGVFVDTDASLPPFLQAYFEDSDKSDQSISLQFEALSLAARAMAIDFDLSAFEAAMCVEKLEPREPEWFSNARTVKAEGNIDCTGADLSKAIKKAATRILKKTNTVEGVEAEFEPPVLKLIGLVINGDIDISKLDIPFSIRMIGCVVKGQMLLDRSKLQVR